MLLFNKAGKTVVILTVSQNCHKKKKKSTNKQQQQSLLTVIRPRTRWADDEAPTRLWKFALSTE